MRSSNGSISATNPALDTLPDSAAFQYIKLNQLVYVPDVRSYTLPSNGSRTFGTRALAGNLATSPGDKGLMMVLADNPIDNDIAIVVPGGR